MHDGFNHWQAIHTLSDNTSRLEQNTSHLTSTEPHRHQASDSPSPFYPKPVHPVQTGTSMARTKTDQPHTTNITTVDPRSVPASKRTLSSLEGQRDTIEMVPPQPPKCTGVLSNTFRP